MMWLLFPISNPSIIMVGLSGLLIVSHLFLLVILLVGLAESKFKREKKLRVNLNVRNYEIFFKWSYIKHVKLPIFSF
jgi:hypothetical protein